MFRIFSVFLSFIFLFPLLLLANDNMVLADNEAGVIFLHHSFYDTGSYGDKYRTVISKVNNKEFELLGVLRKARAVFYKMKPGNYEFLSYVTKNQGGLVKVNLKKKKYYYFIISRQENKDIVVKLLKKENLDEFKEICEKVAFIEPTRKELIKYSKDSKQENMQDLYSSLKRLKFELKVPDGYGIDSWLCGAVNSPEK